MPLSDPARCLICKAFIHPTRSTTCKRCGSFNYDAHRPPLDAVLLWASTYPWCTTCTGGAERYAYRDAA